MKHNNQEPGFSTVELLLVVVAIILVSSVGWYVYRQRSDSTGLSNATPAAITTKKNNSSNIRPSAGVQTPTDSAIVYSSNTIQADTYSIGLPSNWASITTQHGKCGSEATYGDSKGDYFDVCVDPVPIDFAADLVWRIGQTPHGFRLTDSNENYCSIAGSGCAVGDNALSIGILPGSSSTYTNHAKHQYFFFAGNSKQERGINLQIFRDILASFRLKS